MRSTLTLFLVAGSFLGCMQDARAYFPNVASAHYLIQVENRHREDRRIRVEREEGEKWYQLGMQALGNMQMNQAEIYFIQAVQYRNPNSYFELAKLYLGKNEIRKAYSNFVTASSYYHVPARFLFVQKLREGIFESIYRDSQSLIKEVLKELAEEGYGEAQFELGKMYYEGINGKKNIKKAWGWLNRACENDGGIDSAHYAEAEQILQLLPEPGCSASIFGCW